MKTQVNLEKHKKFWDYLLENATKRETKKKKSRIAYNRQNPKYTKNGLN